jgi:hypothetical protein
LIPSPAPTNLSTKYFKRIMGSMQWAPTLGDYGKIHMIRDEGAISHRWSTVKTACNKFHGCIEMVHNKKTSGANMMDNNVSQRCFICIRLVHFLAYLSCEFMLS